MKKNTKKSAPADPRAKGQDYSMFPFMGGQFEGGTIVACTEVEINERSYYKITVSGKDSAAVTYTVPVKDQRLAAISQNIKEAAAEEEELETDKIVKPLDN